jgi:hypothetical protein
MGPKSPAPLLPSIVVDKRSEKCTVTGMFCGNALRDGCAGKQLQAACAGGQIALAHGGICYVPAIDMLKKDDKQLLAQSVRPTLLITACTRPLNCITDALGFRSARHTQGHDFHANGSPQL